MQNKIRTLSIAGVALIGATGLAVAGGASKSSMDQSDNKTGMQQSGGQMSGSKQSGFTKDAIVLTNDQKQTLYQQLAMDADSQDAPSGFTASVGSTLPSDVSLEPVPNDVSTKVPSVANYRFAKLDDDRLLIVDPNDRRVVSIIDEDEGQRQQGQKTN
ncbi:MAG TPA: DUF1236 domain-containing protein [Xanthobacteraceae bacterium]|nr:DUF1236 domain-containing protein [Xanthobacteraceae bacterium]